MSILIAAKELKRAHRIPTWRIIKIYDSIGNNLSSQINWVFLLETVVISYVVQVKVKFATVGHCNCAFVINACKWSNLILLVLILNVARNYHDTAKAFLRNFPNLGQIQTDGGHPMTIFRELQISNSFQMLVLDFDIIEEFMLIELYNVEDFLGLLELLCELQIAHLSLVLGNTLCLSDELFKDANSFDSFTHANQQVSMKCFALAWYAENELLHLFDQLWVWNTTSAPSMHAEVAHWVEVTITEQTSLGPPVESFAFFIMKEGHNAFLVVHISFFANEWVLHFVYWLLEELLILSDQQFLDTL